MEKNSHLVYCRLQLREKCVKFHKQFLKCYMYEKYIHNVPYVYVCTSTANLPRSAKSQWTSKNYTRSTLALPPGPGIKCPFHPISVICPMFVASSLSGQKPQTCISNSSFVTMLLTRKNWANYAYFSPAILFCHLVLLSHPPASIQRAWDFIKDLSLFR